MAKENPRAGGTGASVSNATDTEALSQNPAFTQPTRRRFAVIVSPGLCCGYAVSVEPATITHQPRALPDYLAARTFAEELARLESWPLIDRNGGGER